MTETSDKLTKPEPPETLPKYLGEGLQKQNIKNLNEVIRYADELKTYYRQKSEEGVDPEQLSEYKEPVEDLPDLEYEEDDLEEKGIEVDEDSNQITVETEGATRKGTPYIKRVNCGKDSCTKCPDGERHGRYLYITYFVKGKQKHDYVGKVSG